MNTPSSTPNNSLTTVIGLLIAAIGGPAGIITISDQENPMMILGLIAIWLLFVAVVSLFTPVLEKQRTRMSDAINERLNRFVPGFQKRYCNHIYHRHRDFDVKGLSTQGIYTLELQQVFVDLKIAPQTLHTASTDPIRKKLLDEHNAYPIWTYLGNKGNSNQNQHFAIIGPPGSGKTTLLKHLAIMLTLPRRQRTQFKGLKRLPMLLFLREHRKSITANKSYSLAQVMEYDLQKYDMQFPIGFFAAALKNGKCLVLFDGLDEVADFQERYKVSRWIERQMKSYPGNKFVITSRPNGYRSNPLSGVTLLEVQPFNQEQVKAFVHNWYQANEIMSANRDDLSVQMAAKRGANDLLRRLRNASVLNELAVNPLLLTMIATVHRYRSSLPGRRVELYAEVHEVFLGKRQAAKELPSNLTPPQKVWVLRCLAYAMMRNGLREAPLDSFIQPVIQEPLLAVIWKLNGMVKNQDMTAVFVQSIESSSGLLVERETGIYGFAHHAFQEYLAALHIKEEKLETVLLDELNRSWWHETARLYAAQGDASAIIRACLTPEPPSVEMLVLAHECIEEAQAVKDIKLREELDDLLSKGVEDSNPERRRLAAEVRLALRLRRMEQIESEKYIDPIFVTHAEYQLFLDEMRNQRRYLQPDHWSKYMFPAGQGILPVVGIRSSDAIRFCEWLSKRINQDEWQIRLPQMVELEQCDTNETKIDGVQRGYWVYSQQETIVYESLYPQQKKNKYSIDRVYALLRSIESDFDIQVNLENIRDLDIDLDIEIDVNRFLDIGHVLNVLLDRDKDRGIVLAIVLDRNREDDIVLDIDRVLTLDHDSSYIVPSMFPSSEWEQRMRNLRAYLLICAVDAERQFQEKRSGIQLGRFLNTSELKTIEEERDQYLNFYMDIAHMQERRKGNIPAIEGIRLVRERQAPDGEIEVLT